MIVGHRAGHRRRLRRGWRGRLVRLATTAALAGLLGACGDGSGLSKEEFVAQADERCSRVLREVPSHEIGPDDSAEVVQQKYQQQLSFYQRLFTDLEDLKPPEELEADFGQYQAKTREQADNRRNIAAAHRSSDLARFRSLRHEHSSINDAKKSLRAKIGFKVCQ